MELLWILLALSAGLGIWGAVSQGQAEREQAQTEADRYNEQASWAIDETMREREQTMGTMNANMAAAGISGDSTDVAKGFTLGEYNRAIGKIETQQDWASDDLNAFMAQSRVNQYFNIGSTLLTGVRGGYALGIDQNLWGPGKFNPVSGEVVKPYFNQPKATRGSLYDWYRSYGGMYP